MDKATKVNSILETELVYRVKEKENEDMDIFVETDERTLNLVVDDGRLSRIQFPRVRFVLIRSSSHHRRICLHMMRDIDLFSSFANFELCLGEEEVLELKVEDGALLCGIKSV